MKNKFSKSYYNLIKIYDNLHTQGTKREEAKTTFDGKSLKYFFKPIKQVINLTESKSIIDFGCGKAKYYNQNVELENKIYKNISEYWGIKEYYLYDPAVKQYLVYPSKKMDGVICIDVVEHIPEEDVINFIDEVYKLANKFVFIVIACYPAKKTLPDGRNVHLSIKEAEEWKEIIDLFKKKYSNISTYVVCALDTRKYMAIS